MATDNIDSFRTRIVDNLTKQREQMTMIALTNKLGRPPIQTEINECQIVSLKDGQQIVLCKGEIVIEFHQVEITNKDNQITVSQRYTIPNKENNKNE